MRPSSTSVLALLLLLPARLLALQVPVIVEQVLPDGVVGRTWATGEPVSAGIPFAVEEGISDVGSLGMSGTTAAQFRVLQRDPESGHVTWVLATFLAGSGPYAVTSGGGNFGGANLAQDAASRIVVTTGAAQFEIRKQGFNLLDRVLVDGTELVTTHTDGGVVLMNAGTLYESSRDAASDVVIEDNGPVMAVIRARGVLRDPTGASALDYTVRLHFYKNQTCCRAFVTLRNADLASLSAKNFDAAWAEIPVQLAASRNVLFGFPGAGYTGTVAAGQGAYLFQGDNTFEYSPRTATIAPYLTAAAGLQVVIGGSGYNALGDRTDVTQGWMRLQDTSWGVMAGMRDMAASFPTGFDVTGNRIAVEMFSRHNPQSGLVFSWGAHETREMLFEFGHAGLDTDRFRARVQYPLLGRCTFERFRDTGAHCGERRLVTADEESTFFSELGQTWSVKRYAEADIRFERQYSFGTTGGGNQFDQDECHLLDFMRTGYGGRFQQGRIQSIWKADQCVPHSDDFDYSTHRNGVSDISVTQPTSFHGKGAGNLFDDEHPHWVSMLLYYHLTGDENIREAIVDYGEWRQYRAGNPTYGALWGGGLQHFRLWSRCIRDVALLYEFTGSQTYLDHVRRMTANVTSMVEDNSSSPGTKGQNLDRGYFFYEDVNFTGRLIHVFFENEMYPIGMNEAMRVLPASDSLKEAIRDQLYGLAWFVLQELQVIPSALGYPYEYYTTADNQPGVRGDQTGLILAHGYEMSGNAEFINRARSLAWRVSTYQHWLRNSELSQQVRIYDWIHREQIGAQYITPAVSKVGDRYTLTWTAPDRATSYVVKAAAHSMIEQVRFDPVARTFIDDPHGFTNFWAARNFAGEPTPGAPGTPETFTTPPLPAGTWYFAVKALTRPLDDMPLGDVHLPGGPRPGQPPAGPPRGSLQSPGSTGAVHLDPSQGSSLQAGHAAAAVSPGGAHGVRPRVSFLPDRSGIDFEGVSPEATLRLYDVAGRLIRELQADGSGHLVWDLRASSGVPIARGVVLYRLDAATGAPRRGRIIVAP
jgi:PcRGLX-like protein central beta sandwich domain